MQLKEENGLKIIFLLPELYHGSILKFKTCIICTITINSDLAGVCNFSFQILPFSESAMPNQGILRLYISQAPDQTS
jgi:hypothetical protein